MRPTQPRLREHPQIPAAAGGLDFGDAVFPMSIIAAKMRLASAPPAASASVKTRGALRKIRQADFVKECRVIGRTGRTEDKPIRAGGGVKRNRLLRECLA